MNVGVLRFSIRLPDSHSLKEKRQVVRSLLSQLHNKYNVSAAEVGDYDLWQVAVIAAACISNEKRHTNEVLNKALSFSSTFDLEILESEIEIIDF